MAQKNAFAMGFSVYTLGAVCPRSAVLVASTALVLLRSKANDFWHDSADDFCNPEHQVSTFPETIKHRPLLLRML